MIKILNVFHELLKYQTEVASIRDDRHSINLENNIYPKAIYHFGFAYSFAFVSHR